MKKEIKLTKKKKEQHLGDTIGEQNGLDHLHVVQWKKQTGETSY